MFDKPATKWDLDRLKSELDSLNFSVCFFGFLILVHLSLLAIMVADIAGR